jgi:hypothetical protein
MRLIFISAALFLATVTSGVAGPGSWCARTSSNGFNGDCSFSSFRQCRATVSGQAGDCIRNPRFAYGNASRRYRTAPLPNNAGAGNNGNSFFGANNLDNGNNFGSFR